MKERISNAEKIINMSGNTFHYKVADFLKNNGWNILISPYYNDNYTNKPREVDIVAEKAYDVEYFREWKGTINLRLFIECKYIDKEIVFWFDSKDLAKAVEKVSREMDVDPRNHDINKFHYLSEQNVAKLFATNENKGPDNDVIYKSLNQCLNSMVYFRPGESIIPEIRGRNIRKIIKTINLPIIVLNNFDLLYQVGENNQPVPLSENFQLEVNYSYLNRNKENQVEYFLIDIIDFNKLNIFLNNVEQTEIRMLKDYVIYD